MIRTLTFLAALLACAGASAQTTGRLDRSQIPTNCTAGWNLSSAGVPVCVTATDPASLPTASSVLNTDSIVINRAGTLYNALCPTLIGGVCGTGVSPGGSTAQLQYNNAGAFAGSANLLYYPTPLPAPATPTVTIVNPGAIPATTTLGYMVVGEGLMGYGPSSALLTITNAPNTLSTTNYVQVNTSAVTGATTCAVFKTQQPGQVAGAAMYYLGSIACGSSINDQATLNGASNRPASGATPFTNDNAAGMLLKQNLVVQGNAVIGNGPYALLGWTYENTGGGVNLNVASQLTGAGVGQIDDHANIQSIMYVTPGGNSYVNQPWNIQAITLVPATNTFFIPSLEGIVSAMTINGSGAVDQVENVNAQTTFNNSAGSAFIAASVTSLLSNSGSGTLAEAYAGKFQFDLSGSGRINLGAAISAGVSVNSGTAPNVAGLRVFAPTGAGTVTAYYGIDIEDGSAFGATSRGLYVRGASTISEFLGVLKAGVIGSYKANILVQSGTAYTLAAVDTGGFIQFTNAAAITVTLPNNLPVGHQIAIQQGGAGQITVAAAAGATIRSAHSHTKSFGQYAILGLTVTSNAGGASAVYALSGDGAP